MQFRTMDSGRLLQFPRTRVLGFVLATVAILGAGTARAAEQFWVSLGSFGDLRGAEKVRDQAAADFYQLSIIPSESPIGFVYRVVEGPVSDRSSAEGLLSQARSAGFIDAWLVIQDGDLLFGEIANTTSTESFSESSAYNNLGVSDTYTLPPIQDDYTNAYASDAADYSESPSSADYNQVKIGSEKLVETAPPGYGLHRLERSVNSLPPGAAPDSRLRELRSDTEVGEEAGEEAGEEIGKEVDAQIDAGVDDSAGAEPN